MLKLLTIILASIILGGCTLSNYLSPRETALDAQPSPSSTPTASLSTATDDASLESDLESTIIETEDFSDLE